MFFYAKESIVNNALRIPSYIVIKKTFKVNDHPAVWIILIIILAVAWKIVLLALDSFPFNADEAIVGLMARHIILGKIPLFFYGQGYMGSLDAFLISLGFLLFGEQVWVIRLVQIILYTGTIATVMLVVREMLPDIKAMVIAGLLLAFPTVNVTLYTTVSLGGYGEALLISSLILLFSIRFFRRYTQFSSNRKYLHMALIGFLSGLGFWIDPISMVFGLPCAFLIIWVIIKNQKSKGLLKQAPFYIIGAFIGMIPIWIYAGQNGIHSLLAGINGSNIAVENILWFSKILNHAAYLFIFGLPVIFGLRPPWQVIWLILPAIPVVASIWILTIWTAWRQKIKDESRKVYLWILAGITLVLCIGFIFTNFGADPSGRYFVPLAIPLAIIFALTISVYKKWLYAFLIVAFLLVFNICATLQCAFNAPTKLTTQIYAPALIDHSYDVDLIKFLRQNHETRGYTNYWVAYPLAFLSHEDFIFIPALPYHLDLSHTAMDDKYPDFIKLVSESPSAAFITLGNPALNELLVQAFTLKNISWQETIIGDYHIYYSLSRKTSPEDLGLKFVEK